MGLKFIASYNLYTVCGAPSLLPQPFTYCQRNTHDQIELYLVAFNYLYFPLLFSFIILQWLRGRGPGKREEDKITICMGPLNYILRKK
jgi:hypothetical protein